MSRAAIVTEPIDMAAIVREVSAESFGAITTFMGTVRNSSHGRNVTGLEYSAYVEMAERELNEIVREAAALDAAGAVVAVHRIGELRVGDICVMIAAAHAHRASAFAACRYVIEEIKTRVPIWKRERYVDGSAEWVNACVDAESAAAP